MKDLQGLVSIKNRYLVDVVIIVTNRLPFSITGGVYFTCN